MLTQADCSLFIADLHLSEDVPELVTLFFRFLDRFEHSHFQQLFILGDLFEYWVGDDQLSCDIIAHQVCTRFCQLQTNSQKKIYFIHGNRDFLVDNAFFKQSQVTSLTSPYLFQNNYQHLLLTHGDDLCILDAAYQNFRQTVHTEKWQGEFLAQPLHTRQQIAQQLRQKSKQEQYSKDQTLFRIPSETVIQILTHFKCNILIHGHTHYPSLNFYLHNIVKTESQWFQEWTVPDWNQTAQGCLVLEKDILYFQSIEDFCINL